MATAVKKKKKAGKVAGALAKATAAVANVDRIVVGIKVHFVLNTRDGLRRVIFGLEKNTENDTVKWTINFQLFERDKRTDDYGDAIVDLDVEVDTKLNNKAETAANNGLTPGQSAHALGPAADDAKDAAEGNISQDDARDTVRETLSKK